ncbi:hypothetical protein QW131_06165 [Roseibium salinum]|nr:hypothetical protein [Roseibium salinum]
MPAVGAFKVVNLALITASALTPDICSPTITTTAAATTMTASISLTIRIQPHVMS